MNIKRRMSTPQKKSTADANQTPTPIGFVTLQHDHDRNQNKVADRGHNNQNASYLYPTQKIDRGRLGDSNFNPPDN